MIDIINEIEKLKPYTESSFIEMQKSSIPIVYPLEFEERFSFEVHGAYHSQYRDDRLLFLMKNLPLRVNISRHVFSDMYPNMIMKNEIKPFLLFLNGRFVKWSDIRIISDCKYDYILIDNIDPNTERIKPKLSMILLPDNVEYLEGMSLQDNVDMNNVLFAFDSRGFIVNEITVNCTVIPYTRKKIFNEYIDLIPNQIQKSSLDKEYCLTKDNILVFRDGLFYKDADIEVDGMNMFSVSNNNFNSIMCAKIFYSYSSTIPRNNILIPTNNGKIINDIEQFPFLDYLDNIKKNFDFKYDRNKTYSENISNALDYIMKYNPSLMDNIYLKQSPIETRTYTGEQILVLTDPRGYVTMSRRIDDDIENYVMIFLNGKLYSHQFQLVYIGKDFKFPVVNIYDSDLIEIVIFKNVNNASVPIKFRSESNDEFRFDSNINVHNCKLFTRDPKDKKFPIEVSDKTQYEIEPVVKELDDNKYKIYPKDSFYFDRMLTLAHKNQFRYYYEILKEDKQYVHLPMDFRFCNEESKYLVFINGIKINFENFRVTIVKNTRPFTKNSVYFNIPVMAQDKVEVFYIPFSVSEMINEKLIKSSGNLLVEKSNLGYGLNKDLYLTFINGRKIPLQYMENISASRLKIQSGIQETRNLCVLKYIPDNYILNIIFKNTSSELELALNKLSTNEFEELYPSSDLKPILGINEFDVNKIDMKKIIYQVLEDNYAKSYMYNGDVFIYDFEQIFNERDPEGNLAIPLLNANKEDKL